MRWRWRGYAPNRGIDHAFGGGHLALDQGEVALDHAVRLHLRGELGVGFGVLGDDQQPGRILVEAVDDAGTRGVIAAPKVGGVRQKGVDQRSGGMARRGMHDDACGLVDDEHRIILVDDAQRLLHRRIGRRGRGVACGRGLHDDPHAGLQKQARPRGAPVHGDAARLDGRLRASPREAGDKARNGAVEPLPGEVVGHGDVNERRARRRLGRSVRGG